MTLKRLAAVLLASVIFLDFFPPPIYAATPSVPSNVSVRVGSTQAYGNGTITVSWTKVVGATAYTAKLTKSSDNTTLVQSVTGETNNEVVFNGLSGGATYVVQVRAIQVTDVSDWSSNSLTAVPKTAPKAPAKPTAVPGVGKATISWVKVAASDTGGLDITGYVIREINSATSNSVAADVNTYDYTGLTAGSSAEFTITALNSANTTGTTSEKSDAITIPSVANVMNAPTITSTGNSGEAQVNWVPPSVNGGSAIISFTIKLIKNGADLLTRVISDLTQTFEVFSSLATGTYTAKVASTNGVGISPYSLESGSLSVTAAPVATIAPTPTSSPTPTASASPSSGGGGGIFFGGGGGGGGFIPPPPVVTTSPTPLPSPTPTASASPTALATVAPSPTSTTQAKPTPLPSPTTSPNTSKTSSPSASPTASQMAVTNSKGEVIKTNAFVVPEKITGSIKTTIISATKTEITSSLKVPIQPIVSAKKGTSVKVVVKDESGKSFTVASTTAKATGAYKAPVVKFTLPGTYQVTIVLGTSKKIITYKITK